MAQELVPRINMTDSLYKAASRYENDLAFRRGVPNPDWVAQQLRQIAQRREELQARKAGR